MLTKKPTLSGSLIWIVLPLFLLLSREVHAQTLKIICRDSFVPSVPILLRVELVDEDGNISRTPWDATVSWRVEGSAETGTVEVLNGRGSELIQIPDAPEATLLVEWEDQAVTKSLNALNPAEATIIEGGSLPSGLTEWNGLIEIRDHVTIPSDATLRLLPGTLVLIDGVLTDEDQPGECDDYEDDPDKCGSQITIEGSIESLGTEESPITFTAKVPTEAWGEIFHDNADPSTYEFTIISRGGNSPGNGHTSTGPLILCEDSQITFESCSLTDSAGKVMQGEDSDLIMRNCLLTRAIMGPEIDGTAIQFIGNHILHMKGDDDNDGIYLHSQEDGQVITVKDSVVADGDDDGIDTLRSEVTIENCLVRDYADKGISIFSDTVYVRGCLLVDNEIGLSAKETNAAPRIEHTTFYGNEIGIESRDKNGKPDLFLDFQITHCIIYSDNPVRTDYPEEDIKITFSAIGEDWPGEGNIITADPLLMNPEAFDFRLSPDSPCIDAGNPEGPFDSDGSRKDLGAFPFVTQTVDPTFTFIRGDFNNNERLEIGDPILLLMHMFVGKEHNCPKAGDTDDSGELNVGDAITLLTRLFLGGDVLPEPNILSGCGEDTTEDEIACEEAQCQ